MKIKSQFEYFVDYLDVYNISYKRNDDEYIKRVLIEKENMNSLSIIFGIGTYGYNLGLLEVSINKEEPIGFLSVTQMINIYKEWLGEKE